MDCLYDYIGIRGCGEAIPPSLIYLNDLEGISMKSISSLPDAQQQNFVGVYADIQTRALLRLKDDFVSAIGKRYRLKHILDTISLPKSNLDLTKTATVVGATNKCGVVIDLDYGLDSQFIGSPMAAPYVQQLFFYCPAGAVGDTVTFKIYDVNTNTLLLTTTKLCALGWNAVEINKLFANQYYDKTRKLFIGFEITTNNGTVTPVYYAAPSLLQGSCCEVRLTGGIMSSSGVVTESIESFGLACIFSVRCDYGSLICTNKDLFKRTLLYALGVETMREQQFSERLNEFTILRKAQAEALETKFTADYNKALMQVAEGIDLDCDCCIECGGTNSYTIIETL